jgi:hypothetical protein
MGNTDWCLHSILDESDPSCTTDQALVVTGNVSGAQMDIEVLGSPRNNRGPFQCASQPDGNG